MASCALGCKYTNTECYGLSNNCLCPSDNICKLRGISYLLYGHVLCKGHGIKLEWNMTQKLRSPSTLSYYPCTLLDPLQVQHIPFSLIPFRWHLCNQLALAPHIEVLLLTAIPVQGSFTCNRDFTGFRNLCFIFDWSRCFLLLQEDGTLKKKESRLLWNKRHNGRAF